MKVSLFYEHQLPRPWHADSELRLIQDALEQVVLADRLGFGTVWEVEHHFLEEYSHSSAPEVFLAACAGMTNDIRLGHGIVQMPPPYNHPARVAERIAMLDLVSRGRVEFGTGESSAENELGGFDIDPSQKRAMWREAVQVATKCLTEVPFRGWEGDFVSMPPRNVVPKPVQHPHPPVWVACSRRETIRLAAQHGIGALSFAFVDPEEAGHWVADYHRTLELEGVPIGRAVNPKVACVTTFMCAETELAAIERGIDGANFFGFSLGHYYAFGDHRPGATDVWQEFQDKGATYGYSPAVARAASLDRLGAKIAQQGSAGLRGAVGTPDQIRHFLRRYEDAGVDEVILVAQAGHNRHEHIMEAIDLVGTKVLPEIIERDEIAVEAKARKLAPVIDQVMARMEPERPPLPADFSIPALNEGLAGRSGWKEQILDAQRRKAAASAEAISAGD